MTRVATLLACALILLGIRTLAEGAYRSYLTAAILALLVVAGALALYTIVAWVRGLWLMWRDSRSSVAAERADWAEPPAAEQAPE